MDKVLSEQLGLLRQEALSLAPTVTSPRTLIKDLLGNEALGASSPWVPRSALGFATAGVLLGMLTGLVLVLLSRWSDASRHTVASARPVDELAASRPASASGQGRSVPGAPVVRKTRLSVETIPSSARVGVDGTLLPFDAHDVVMVNDHAAHRVWAEAPGFQTRAEWIKLEGDQVAIKLILAPIERSRTALRDSAQEASRPGVVVAKRSPGAAPAAPVMHPPPSKNEAPPKPSKARVQLDAADPWKN